MELNPDFWSQRYNNDEAGWDIGSASTPLVNFFETLADTSIKILIPGGGNGHEAEYLYRKGFNNVYLLDWSQEPLDNFHKRLPNFPSNQLIKGDFFEHIGGYDLIVEQTFFCAIDPALRNRYALQMHQLLLPKGRLVGLLFTHVLNESGPPFGGSKEEYLGNFSPLFKIEKMEMAADSIKPRAGRELFINLLKR